MNKVSSDSISYFQRILLNPCQQDFEEGFRQKPAGYQGTAFRCCGLLHLQDQHHSGNFPAQQVQSLGPFKETTQAMNSFIMAIFMNELTQMMMLTIKLPRYFVTICNVMRFYCILSSAGLWINTI